MKAEVNILITGGSGLVGRTLSEKLSERGYRVAWLSTQTSIKKSDKEVFMWNIEKRELDVKAIENAHYILHLAGANVSDKRWTSNTKKVIVDSRVKSAELLLSKVLECNSKLRAFISSSGINYYGTVTSEKVFSETDSPGKDFLARTCVQWEAVADKFEEAGIRTVKVRTGVVLSSQGGALKKMMLPVKYGLGSALGKGNQYIPWIHIDDLCAIYIKAIEDEQMRGAYNAVAAEPVTNKEFMRALANHLHKPFVMPAVPSFILNLLLGEMSEIVLKGSRASCEKIKSQGFQFKYEKVKDALNDLL